MAVLVSLVDQIMTNGVGFGGSQILEYTVAPPADPPNVDMPAIAYDPNGVLPNLNWNTATHTWI